MTISRGLLEEIVRRQRRKEELSLLLDGIRGEYFDKQLAFVDDPARNKAALCTRRAGKTSMWSRHLTSVCLEHPKSLVRVWATSRLRVKQLLWVELKDLFRRHRIKVVTDEPVGDDQVKMHETELSVRFGNGSEIRLLGADKDREVQKKRGDKTRMEVVIEAQLFGPYLKTLVEDVAEPCLFDLRGTMCLEGTPGPICSGYWYDVSGREEAKSTWTSPGDAEGVGAGWSCHRWSVLDNPFLPHAADEIEHIKRTKRWDSRNPTYLREYCGLWVNDLGALFYRFDDRRNIYDPSQVQPWGPGWKHVLGWDLGAVDSMALVVWGWHREDSTLYEAFSWKQSGALMDEVMDQIKRLEDRGFDFIAKVADTGGGGKMLVNETMARHATAFEAAKKTEKAEHVRMMNDDYLTGKIKLIPGSPLQLEVASLPTDPDWDPSSGRPPLEHPGFDNHCADASLYSWRRAYNFLAEAAPVVHKPGTLARYLEKEEKYVEHLATRHRSRPWWEPDQDFGPDGNEGLD